MPADYGQWMVAILTTVCFLTSGQIYAWAGAAQPMILDGSAGFTLTKSETAGMITITFLGNILSPIPSGALMDRIGRRNTLRAGLLLAIAAWIILAFLFNVVAICIARVLMGMWAGVIYTVVPAFIGEVVDPKIRGSMGALSGLMLYVGALFESLVSNFSYQTFIFLSAIPPIVLFVALLFIPESPYYYLRKEQREQAKNSIIWLKGSCNDEDLDLIQAKVVEQMAMKGSFFDLFKTPASRRAFSIVEVLLAVQRCSGATILFAYSTVLVPKSWISPQNSFLVLTIVWIIGSFPASVIMDKFNRRTLLAVSCLGSGLSMAAATAWYYMRDFTTIDTSTTRWLPLLLLIISGLFYSMGIVSIPTIVQSELYPVNLKSIGSACACITANIVSGAVTQLVYPINSYIGVYFNFLIMAIAPLGCIIFIFTVMVETKGKSLEAIQDMLNKRNK
uniref:Facilitated trehalose transporter Tret1 n=1 Tax=Lygus hesperus TaxID=30085 RepID=A0A0A9WV06_LYGHE